jgi:hypothetical protein
MNVVKLLPPLVCTEEDISYLVASLDEVLADAHRNALVFEFGKTLAKAALGRDR